MGNEFGQSIIFDSTRNDSNEIEKQRQHRLEKKREQARSYLEKGKEGKRRIRIEKQRKRTQTNRTKKKLENCASVNIATQQRNTDIQSHQTEESMFSEDDSVTEKWIGVEKWKMKTEWKWMMKSEYAS